MQPFHFEGLARGLITRRLRIAIPLRLPLRARTFDTGVMESRTCAKQS
jgi:hypothetical protein